MSQLILTKFAQIIRDDEVNLPTTNLDGNLLRENILPMVFLVAGGISIIFIVIGGLKYVMSTGDPQQTTKAKDTIMYAVIGLVISLLAFVLVTIVVRILQGA